MMGTISDAGILAQLKALHRTWCENDDEATANSGDDQQQLNGDKQKQTVPLNPLETARAAISELPALTPLNDSGEGAIVPYLFSALHKSDNLQLDDKPSQTLDKKNNPMQEYELRQMEWHIVLILELWSCASQSTLNASKPKVLDVLCSAILLYKEQKSQHRIIDNSNKKKKKKRKRDKKTTPKNLSEQDKEKLLLDHFVDLLSRAPFLLPRDVPLSQFLNNRILTSNRHFGERVPRVVKHICTTFEIPLKKEAQPNRKLTTKKEASKKQDNDQAKKRKSDKLQAQAKSKKRQRLASLTAKRKHRGSHFHRNFDDISKLLDRKPKPTLSSKSSLLKERKPSSKNLGNTNNKRQRLEKVDPIVRKKNNIRNENCANAETKTKKSRQKTNIDDLLADPVPVVLSNKKKTLKENSNNNAKNDIDANKRGITEALPMTPRRTIRSEASRSIAETPVPKSSDRTLQTVVGETPVPSRAFQTVVGQTPVPSNRTVVGETPTYGSTPLSSSSDCPPFFSPPALPSPSIPSKQPVKLFGLLKRTNSVGQRGMSSKQGEAGKRAGLKRTSSIDNARAFLRAKSL